MMLTRWKSKDKSASNQSNNNTSSSSSSSKKKRKGREGEEDWQNENKSGRMPSNEQNDDRRRGMRREDPRRHTLGGDMLVYATNQGQLQQRSIDLEMGTRAQKHKKNQPTRGYAPMSQGPLFDDDPGIMSEVETASTGFRRGGKQRSSLPVVRTPSKTLERPLGLVFLQYRSETKRALLPNEITSIDTVRALFVRSFPRQLTMAYLEGPNVKIYIHDPSKDMFYELEDVRSHLREIRDRSVLRLFESTEVAAPPQIIPGGAGIPQPLPQAAPAWDQDQNYFSEPEFDSDYKNQHIHKSKIGKQPPYYVGASQTLPRGMYSDRNKVPIGAPVKPLRSHNSRGSMEPLFSYPPDQLYSIPDGYSSSPERNSRGNYEEPYYSQYGTRGQIVAPIIDEEQSEIGMSEDQYSIYGMKGGLGRIPRTGAMYDPTRPEDLHRFRVEHMERQLASLTGLVQKALVNQNMQVVPPTVQTLDQNYLVVPMQSQANGSGDELYVREKAPKLGKNSCQKSVSFEKNISYSDDNKTLQKSIAQHAADTKPTKSAIKSSTLPRTSSQAKSCTSAERDRLKPPPPPKPSVIAHQTYHPDITLAPEVYNHLRGLQKKAKDLRTEVRTLRRLSQAQAVAVRDDINVAFMQISATLLACSGNYWGNQGDKNQIRISREEDLYKQEIIRLEKDLSDLETSVESLRGEVINRRSRVNMTVVEDMALVLSRASKTVAELKMRFPELSNGLRCIIANEMEKVVREEKFLKEEPDRLESALRRCKKLTGTLVTLKRLASVQEQRQPPNDTQQINSNEDPPRSAEIATADKPIPTPRMGSFNVSGGPPPENALDALLDELQTFSKPLIQNNEIRPDDSTSDESSQAVQSTVTTQISQARLYTQTDTINAQQLQQQLQQQPLPLSLDQQAAVVQTGLLVQQSRAAATAANAGVNHTTNTPLLLHTSVGSLRRLNSYPSGSETDVSTAPHNRTITAASRKPPVPERNADLISKIGHKRIPPPPPPRTSSRSPLASPTSPNVPQHLPALSETAVDVVCSGGGVAKEGGSSISSASSVNECNSDNSSGNESGNDQAQRQLALEMRHQELLRKQKQLQEQYQLLQQRSKMPAGGELGPPEGSMPLMKMGSESNLQHRMMAFSIAAATDTVTVEANLENNGTLKDMGASHQNRDSNGSLEQQAGGGAQYPTDASAGGGGSSTTTTTKQVYETEIL